MDKYDFDGMKNWLDDWACDHDLAHPQAFAEYMVSVAKLSLDPSTYKDAEPYEDYPDDFS